MERSFTIEDVKNYAYQYAEEKDGIVTLIKNRQGDKNDIKVETLKRFTKYDIPCTFEDFKKKFLYAKVLMVL